MLVSEANSFFVLLDNTISWIFLIARKFALKTPKACICSRYPEPSVILPTFIFRISDAAYRLCLWITLIFIKIRYPYKSITCRLIHRAIFLVLIYIVNIIVLRLFLWWFLPLFSIYCRVGFCLKSRMFLSEVPNVSVWSPEYVLKSV